MKLRILSVGHKMPNWVESACSEYIKRMPREMVIEIVEIKPDKRAAGKNAQQVQEAESKRILETAGKDYLIALDEHGATVTTIQLADRMQSWQREGRDVSLVIGGADGLHPDIKARAHWMWSLSALTMPHGMVRVMLTEQLYRAWSVIKNHPYHRE
ncbi:23S rRNA (pseudouridine(1915)-N(3))-methyltransferase RlmH [Methylovorus sp. MM2]|uniref:23S rRNA (pseudouridine(1915)-N(3))-methyltransferase RlmH n=1 Tax=Methylovorus sp. MM2 TaxID=1848038 RepID=UPI0007E07056|nr:23S rRNA (pseudouridine(1915)-N(3))-methyltransferase RlmH [Methylovorus sp. MM2]OAM51460.1 23S rRNA (pseudouridine(1915)-N(3))-methyltransferase RlmH [Methylovorus sp. MM2]